MVKLTPQEEQAMQAIWEIGEGNVKAILALIAAPQPPYTTLASTIKNLEKKGYVTATAFGNSYVYSAKIKEADYKKKFMQGFIAEYFENSYKDLVSFFAKEKKITAKELKEILAQIENK
jgi:BlaI family transcriptional regulator, penicillinase repressor